MRIISMGVITSFAMIFANCTGEKPLRSKSRIKSLVELKKDLEVATDPTKKFYIQSDIVKKYASEPMTAETSTEAVSFSTSLLEIAKNFEKDWNYGNAIHHGNLVLGRVKLFKGDVSAAKKYLILASQTRGSPQLGSFGPNMTLAQELLKKGEKEVVLKYFENCLIFWKSPYAAADVDAWKLSISKGNIPEFGAHLVY